MSEQLIDLLADTYLDLLEAIEKAPTQIGSKVAEEFAVFLEDTVDKHNL